MALCVTRRGVPAEVLAVIAMSKRRSGTLARDKFSFQVGTDY